MGAQIITDVNFFREDESSGSLFEYLERAGYTDDDFRALIEEAMGPQFNFNFNLVPEPQRMTERCAICLNFATNGRNYNQDNMTLARPCGHCFHKNCLIDLANSYIANGKPVICPLCRSNLNGGTVIYQPSRSEFKLKKPVIPFRRLSY